MRQAPKDVDVDEDAEMEILTASPNAVAMRNLVVCVAFLYQLILMYVKFDLHLRMSEVQLQRYTKIFFTLILGSLAFVGDFYRLVLANTAVALRFMPFVVSMPGVLITVILWVYFVMSLKFKPLHAFEIDVYTYLYFQTVTGVTRLVGALFFAQDPSHIDYGLYLGMYLINFIVSNAFYIGMYHILEVKPEFLIIKGMGENTAKGSIAFPFFQLFFIYICAACIMIFVPKTVTGSFLSLCMLVLFSAFSISLNSNRYAQAKIREKEKQMESLLNSLNQFTAIKHDFYNILHTYNGYFELGDLEACKQYHESLVEITTRAGDLLDLSRRAVEHPALISLLLNKHEQAERLKVGMSVSLGCPLSQLPIEDIDICRVVACLLDNAIEAAAESRQKRVTFTIGQENETENKSIVITNSSCRPMELTKAFTLGFTSKKGHQGTGLVNVKRIMEKYPLCELEMENTDNGVKVSLRLADSHE